MDALHGGLEKLQQAASFCRVRAYLSMDSLVAAVASARGNVGSCLQGTQHTATPNASLRDPAFLYMAQVQTP